MFIILKNHSEEYAAREITNAYFPKLKITFSENCPENEDYILSEYAFDGESHTYSARVVLDNQKEEYSFSEKTYSKTHIKKSISRCLEKLTGIHLPWGLLTGIRPSKIVREHFDEIQSTDCREYLKELYETDTDKAVLAWNVAINELSAINSMDNDKISLYVGIPFCPTRCLYCSFTSQSVAFSNKLTSPYVDALKKEIREVSKLEKIEGKVVDTIYFGGGTPSALSAEQIDDILITLKENFNLSEVREITFEAGRPDTVTEEKLEILKKHGISRISINPQTAKNETLEIIGRNHTAEDFVESFHLARNMGFSHINCDIIAGLPGETPDDFKKTLDLLESLNPESITVHTMCIKRGSYLDMKYDMYSLSAASIVNQMLSLAYESMEKSGKIPYYMYRQKNMLGNLENVGYCTPGHECLYNIYIMEEIQTIISLGAGGSTKIINGDNIERIFNVKEVSEYIKRIDEMIERKRNM